MLSVRPARGLMMGPPQTPTPVFINALSRLYRTAYTSCSVTGCLPGNRNEVGSSLKICRRNRVRESAARTILLIRYRDGSLQDAAGPAIHIKLTAREPAQVAGIGRIEQEQRRLAVQAQATPGSSFARSLQSGIRSRLAWRYSPQIPDPIQGAGICALRLVEPAYDSHSSLPRRRHPPPAMRGAGFHAPRLSLTDSFLR